MTRRSWASAAAPGCGRGEGREKSGALGAVGMGLGRMDTPATPGREEKARRRPGLAAPEGGRDGHRRGSAKQAARLVTSSCRVVGPFVFSFTSSCRVVESSVFSFRRSTEVILKDSLR